MHSIAVSLNLESLYILTPYYNQQPHISTQFTPLWQTAFCWGKFNFFFWWVSHGFAPLSCRLTSCHAISGSITKRKSPRKEKPNISSQHCVVLVKNPFFNFIMKANNITIIPLWKTKPHKEDLFNIHWIAL